MKLSLKSKKLFFYHLQVMLNAGMPLSEGIKSYKVGVFAKDGMKWADEMRVKGRPLSSLMLTSNLFEPYEIGLIKVGEKSGSMVEVLKGLGLWFEKSIALRRKLFIGLLYPSFVLFLLPIIMNLPSLFKEATITDYFFKVFLFYIPYIVMAFLIGVLIPKLLVSNNATGRMLEEVIFRIPVLGRYIRDNYIKKIVFANGLALKSGLGVKESLSLTLSVTPSPSFYRDIEKALILSNSGVSYSSLIAHFKWLDDESKSVIATSEKTGSVSDGMEQIYRLKTAENEARSMLLIIIFGTSILLYALGMVGYHVILMAMEYVNMIGQYADM